MANPVVPTWQVIDDPIAGEDEYLPQTQGGAAIYGDYDNDGDLDLFFCAGGDVKLYRNDGKLTYTSVELSDDLVPMSGCAAVWSVEQTRALP